MSSRYQEVVLSRRPVAYWRLGDSAGQPAVDVTGNGHHGTYHGAPTFGQPGAIQGDPDTAVRFNGTDYIEIPDSPDFSQPTSPDQGLSVEAWMRPDSLAFPGQSSAGSTQNPYVYWLGKGEPQQYEWGLRFYSSEPSQDAAARPNRCSAYIWNAIGKEGAGAFVQEVVVPGEWIHIVACYEPGDKNTCPPKGVLLYKNGVWKDGPTRIGTLYCNPCFAVLPAHGPAPVRLGTRDLRSFFVGALDEVAVYPRVLTPDEILENYLAGISSDPGSS